MQTVLDFAKSYFKGNNNGKIPGYFVKVIKHKGLKKVPVEDFMKYFMISNPDEIMDYIINSNNKDEIERFIQQRKSK